MHHPCLRALAALSVVVGASAAHADEPADTSPDASVDAETTVDAQILPLEPGPHIPAYEPLATFEPGGTQIQLRLMARETIEAVGDFEVDRDGETFAPDPVANTTVRLGGSFDSRRAFAPVGVFVEVEGDVVTGVHVGSTTGSELADDLPNDDELATELRKAWARFSVTQYAHLMGGVMMSHWGLGLLANDGDHGWAPGNAYFSDPRGGDRVLRGALMIGPFSDQQIAIIGAYDVVLDDDVLRGDDEATQMIGSVVWGYNQPTNAGAYVVMREQETSDGDVTEVIVIDAAGAHEQAIGDAGVLSVAGEIAGIIGTTELSPSVDFPENDVRQMAAAVRGEWAARRWGVVLDGVYASGDRNFDDGEQTGFRLDDNYHLGQLLHRYVWTAWTARGVVTASDPDLVGVPADDLERLTSRGSVTNVVALFPRGLWRPITELEIYGGPLLAWSATDAADPFNTRIAGGDPRNALDGDPGAYLATELDLGVRYRRVMAGTELVMGVEGAALLPGPGMQNAAGESPGTVLGGRFMISYRL